MSLSNFAVTQSGGKDTVTTTTILDGTIANADVASDAAIAVSKIDLGNTLEIETSSGDQIFEMDIMLPILQISRYRMAQVMLGLISI